MSLTLTRSGVSRAPPLGFRNSPGSSFACADGTQIALGSALARKLELAAAAPLAFSRLPDGTPAGLARVVTGMGKIPLGWVCRCVVTLGRGVVQWWHTA